MLKIQPNSRQIVSRKDYLSNAKYCDILYGHLQKISKRDLSKSPLRYVPKSDVKFSVIAEQLGFSRQTISKRFKSMLEGEKDSLALIRYDDQQKKYYLIELQKSASTLIEHTTLTMLVSTMREHVISIYVYLLNRYIASQCQEFQYSIGELKRVVGWSDTSTGNNYLVNTTLTALKKLGLLDVRYQTIKEPGKHQKTHCFIKWMKNTIDDLPEDLDKEEIGQKTIVSLKRVG